MSSHPTAAWATWPPPEESPGARTPSNRIAARSDYPTGGFLNSPQLGVGVPVQLQARDSWQSYAQSSPQMGSGMMPQMWGGMHPQMGSMPMPQMGNVVLLHQLGNGSMQPQTGNGMMQPQTVDGNMMQPQIRAYAPTTSTSTTRLASPQAPRSPSRRRPKGLPTRAHDCAVGRRLGIPNVEPPGRAFAVEDRFSESSDASAARRGPSLSADPAPSGKPTSIGHLSAPRGAVGRQAVRARGVAARAGPREVHGRELQKLGGEAAALLGPSGEPALREARANSPTRARRTASPEQEKEEVRQIMLEAEELARAHTEAEAEVPLVLVVQGAPDPEPPDPLPRPGDELLGGAATRIQRRYRGHRDRRLVAGWLSAARLARRDNNSSNSGRRRIVLGGATVDNLMCWSPMQVAAWVRTDVGIPARAEAFVEHAIGGAVLLHLDDVSLRSLALEVGRRFPLVPFETVYLPLNYRLQWKSRGE
jgi:hypothetical protein